MARTVSWATRPATKSPTPDGGKRNTFQSYNGHIYWSPNTGAWEIGGSIFAHWGDFGYETGPLGYPTSDEITNPDGVGKRNSFQNAGDHIYWSPNTGNQEIGGSIFAHWGDFGYETGPLGYPTSDEITNPDGVGKRNSFQNAGDHIYWSPNTGNQEIGGAIFDKWGNYGYETGILGYPTSDEFTNPDGVGKRNNFQGPNGSIYFSPATGAHEIDGAIFVKWGQTGYETGCLRYPTSDVVISSTGKQSTFSGGTVTYNNASGQALSECNAPGTNQDYMAPGDAVNPQCSQPVSARVGNWWCADAASGSAAKPSASAAPNSTEGFCNLEGCYDVYDSFHADFQSSNGTWGYGPQVIGNESEYVNWQLIGAQTRANPIRYTNSVPTTNVIFSGDQLNAAPGAEGDPVGGAYDLYNAGDSSVLTPTTWGPDGYQSYDNTAYNHSQVIQVSWKYQGYPGYWYTYVKSPSSYDPNRELYRFDSASPIDTQLPAKAVGGGYRS